FGGLMPASFCLEQWWEIAPVFGTQLSMLAWILGPVGLFEIWRSRGRLRGAGIAIAGMLIPVVFSIAIVLSRPYL
ncbi:MAG: hypothetical protein MUQ56_12465, partial [Thermoleophilia bacterium]|nr:hypothetical protein [Thermoleophilia bacterium]